MHVKTAQTSDLHQVSTPSVIQGNKISDVVLDCQTESHTIPGNDTLPPANSVFATTAKSSPSGNLDIGPIVYPSIYCRINPTSLADSSSIE